MKKQEQIRIYSDYFPLQILHKFRVFISLTFATNISVQS